MKNKFHPIFTIAPVVACGLAVLAGCATSGYEQADRTGQKLEGVQKVVLDARDTINEAMVELTQISETAKTNPRDAFDDFDSTVNELERIRENAAKASVRMQDQGADFFTEWQNQLATINDPDMRRTAQQRMDELRQVFADTRPLLQDVKYDFDPFLSDLQDLRTLLNMDLTADGIDSANRYIDKAISSGTKLQKSMDELVAGLTRIRLEITPADVPPPPKDK